MIKKPNLINGWSWRCGLLLLVLLISGCAAGRTAFNKGQRALDREHYDQAVTSFLTAVQKEPDSHKYRMKLEYAREKAAFLHKTEGDSLLAKRNYAGALREYQLAADLDGSLYVASEGEKLAGRYLQAEKLTADATELFNSRRRLQAKDTVEKALQFVSDYQPALRLLEKIKGTSSTVIDGVELEVTSDQPITLNFNSTKLTKVFDVLTKLSGINFILDQDVRDTTTSLYLEKATFAQALELLLRMNKLDKKVLNRKTIILYPKTRDKERQFQDQVIHTFYLSNIDAKKAVNLLRTMLQVRKIYVNEALNAIVMRDNPEVIKLAQKILEANDRSDSEVVFDLELIEINYSDTRDLGLKLSSYNIGAGLAIPGSTIVKEGLSAGDEVDGLINGINGFKTLDPFFAIPNATFRLMKTLVDAEILASPKIRVKNKGKAKVHIGSREPVITTTINGTQTSENVQYVDVGVKLDVEPNIQLDNTIVTKLGLEVSNVSSRQKTDTGTEVLAISTTNANTSLTLKDGEQTVIGGLIRDDKSVTKYKVPLLGDIPLLGELFNGTDNKKSKREILLSITPHIVKSVTLPEDDAANIWSGGEDDLKYGRNFGTFASEYVTGQQNPIKKQTLREPVPELPAAPSVRTKPQSQVKPESVPPATEGSTQGGLLPGPQPQAESAPAPVAPIDTTENNTPAKGSAAPGTGSATPSQPMPPAETVPQVQIAQRQPSSVAGPRVFVQGPQVVQVGATFSVTVKVAEIKQLFSAPLYVRYDAALLKLVGATEGSFLRESGGPTVFTHSTLEGGRIIVGLKLGAGRQGVSGDGDLFRLQFKALAAGTTQIDPSRTNFRNPRGDRLRVESAGLGVVINK